MAWDIERTKTLLLAAATREFSDKGFSGARVDSIAAAAGVDRAPTALPHQGRTVQAHGLARSPSCRASFRQDSAVRLSRSGRRDQGLTHLRHGLRHGGGSRSAARLRQGGPAVTAAQLASSL